MAYILTNTNESIHLTHCHLFGRQSNAVETCIHDPFVSRIHFLIEYHQNNWFVVDYSRNGTWVNGEKVQGHQKQLLKQGDKISCGKNHSNIFTLHNDSPPKDMLCQRDSNDRHFNKTVELGPQNLFSNGAAKDIVIARKNSTWVVEGHSEINAIGDQEWIEIAGKLWQLQCPDGTQHTIELNNPAITVHDICLSLETSLDEETVSCKLQTPLGDFDLKIRSHHYVILLLARRLVQDQNSQIDATECGWLYMDELIRQTGLPETQLNILIYRARKQFSHTINHVVDSNLFLQRRHGQVRLGVNRITVYKGSKRECSTCSGTPELY